MRSRINRETGATLVISLVFLLVFLVMALSIFRGSLTSSQAIGNMQWRNEAISAANEAIDRMLSTPTIATQAPAFTEQFVKDGGYTYDLNGDGNNEIVVTFPVVEDETGTARQGPQCRRVVVVPQSALDPDRAVDAGCFGSAGSGGLAVAGESGTTPVGGASTCSDTDWSMRVRATDTSTNTSVDVVQGFQVRVLTVSVPECD